MTTAKQPPRTSLANGLDISRLVCGLWQVADIEKNGVSLDPEKAADGLAAYARQGFDSFDMADHYGSAELIAGHLLKRYPAGAARPVAFTKWCPEPGPMTPAVVRAGVQQRLDRLGVTSIDLLQFHWWSFEHPAWLDALHQMKTLRDEGLIRAIGVTNFDAAHLALALADGIPIATNQISFSLVDRRAAGDLRTLCKASGVWLLAYGTLCGGFLSGKWLGAVPVAADHSGPHGLETPGLDLQRRHLLGVVSRECSRRNHRRAHRRSSTPRRQPQALRPYAGCRGSRGAERVFRWHDAHTRGLRR